MVLLMHSGIINIGTQLVAAVLQVPTDIVAAQIPMVAPFPTSPAEIAHRQAVDDVLSESSEPWASKLGYMLDEDVDSKVVNDKMDMLKPATSEDPDQGKTSYRPSTYGEITTLGARQLFHHMGMTGNLKSTHGGSNFEGEKDGEIVFIDMGSGAGKLVMQAYMELPRLSSSIGIELAPLRHQHATISWQELDSTAQSIRNEISSENTALAKDATVNFMQGDFLETDLSEVTHMYVSSLCFTTDMMHQLAAKLESGAPKLQCVATLRAFPRKFQKRGILDRKTYQLVDKMFGMIQRTEYVEMSWTDRIGIGCAVYVYTKSPLI